MRQEKVEITSTLVRSGITRDTLVGLGVNLADLQSVLDRELVNFRNPTKISEMGQAGTREGRWIVRKLFWYSAMPILPYGLPIQA